MQGVRDAPSPYCLGPADGGDGQGISGKKTPIRAGRDSPDPSARRFPCCPPGRWDSGAGAERGPRRQDPVAVSPFASSPAEVPTGDPKAARRTELQPRRRGRSPARAVAAGRLLPPGACAEPPGLSGPGARKRPRRPERPPRPGPPRPPLPSAGPLALEPLGKPERRRRRQRSGTPKSRIGRGNQGGEWEGVVPHPGRGGEVDVEGSRARRGESG